MATPNNKDTRDPNFPSQAEGEEIIADEDLESQEPEEDERLASRE